MSARTTRGLRIATRCTSIDQFVAAFHRFCDEQTCFISTLTMRPVGLETAFSIDLAHGAPALRGLGIVVEAWPTPGNRYGRPGLVLGVRKLTADSEQVFARLLRARTEATPTDVLPPQGSSLVGPLLLPTVQPDPMRTPGSELVLPANPLMNISDHSLEGFVDCTLYEETGNFFPVPDTESDAPIDAPVEPIAHVLATAPPPPIVRMRVATPPMPAVAARPAPSTLPPPAMIPTPPIIPTPPPLPAAMPPALAPMPTPAPMQIDLSYARIAPPTVPTNPPYVRITPPPMQIDPPYARITPPPMPAARLTPELAATAAPADSAPSTISIAAIGMPPRARSASWPWPSRRLAVAGAAAVVTIGVALAIVGHSSRTPTTAATRLPAPKLVAVNTPPPRHARPPEAPAHAVAVADVAPAPATATVAAHDDDDASDLGGSPMFGSGPCKIAVSTTPAGSIVSVDGEIAGPSPITIGGPCTRRKLEIAHPRYQPIMRVVMARPDTAPVDVALARPTHDLYVETYPAGAVVSIDGRRAGTSPTLVKVMGFTTLSLRIEKFGFRSTSQKIYSKSPRDHVSVRLGH